MQVYVQKSTRTTFPRRSLGVSGDELSQPVAPSKAGRRPSTCDGCRRLNRLTEALSYGDDRIGEGFGRPLKEGAGGYRHGRPSPGAYAVGAKKSMRSWLTRSGSS